MRRESLGTRVYQAACVGNNEAKVIHADNCKPLLIPKAASSTERFYYGHDFVSYIDGYSTAYKVK